MKTDMDTRPDDISPPCAEETAPAVRLERDSAGRLLARIDGAAETHKDLRLVRYFPWSMPDAYISVRTAEGRELAVLSDIDQLDAESRQVLEAELRDKVFNPRILRILEYNFEFGIASVKAETDRGQVQFQFRGRNAVRLLSSIRALIRDVDNNSYELADFNSLDPVSQRHLQRYF